VEAERGPSRREGTNDPAAARDHTGLGCLLGFVGGIVVIVALVCLLITSVFEPDATIALAGGCALAFLVPVGMLLNRHTGAAAIGMALGEVVGFGLVLLWLAML